MKVVQISQKGINFLVEKNEFVETILKTNEIFFHTFRKLPVYNLS